MSLYEEGEAETNYRNLSAYVLRQAIMDSDWPWFLGRPEDVSFWADAAGLDSIDVYRELLSVFRALRRGTGTIERIIEALRAA